MAFLEAPIISTENALPSVSSLHSFILLSAVTLFSFWRKSKVGIRNAGILVLQALSTFCLLSPQGAAFAWDHRLWWCRPSALTQAKFNSNTRLHLLSKTSITPKWKLFIFILPNSRLILIGKKKKEKKKSRQNPSPNKSYEIKNENQQQRITDGFLCFFQFFVCPALMDTFLQNSLGHLSLSRSFNNTHIKTAAEWKTHVANTYKQPKVTTA